MATPEFPTQKEPISREQIFEIGELLKYSSELRIRSPQIVEQELSGVLGRLKDSGAIAKEHYDKPTSGFEIAAGGVMLGALPPGEVRLEVINFLQKRGHLVADDWIFVNRLLRELDRGKSRYGEDTQEFNAHISALIDGDKSLLSQYLKYKEMKRQPADNIRLLTLTACHSSSLDPAFRSSDIVEQIAGYVKD